MSVHDFSHGSVFLMKDKEYVVKKANHREVVLEEVHFGVRGTFLIDELLQAWMSGELKFKITSNNPEREIEYDSDLLPEEAKRRFAVLEPFIKGHKTYANLNDHLKEHEISQGTFYNWLRVWMRYRDTRHLVPNKRGPRDRTSSLKVIQIAQDVVKEMAYTKVKTSVHKMYREFKLRIKELNEYREEAEQEEIFSYTTFWRIHQKEKDIHKLNSQKYGKQKADLIKKGSQGRIHTERILERVEIDWTQADILLVNPITLKRQRPWIVYAIDVHSGQPLGFHTTFEVPNTAAFKQCLLHCFLPKTYIKEVYPLIRNEWNAYGIPKEIVLDNAKVNESYDLQDVCRIYGIDIQYCSIASGHQKGTIERAFRTLNEKLIHATPGTTFSNPFERGEYDSEGEACVTLQAFNYLVHIALVDMISHDWRHSVTRAGIPHKLWQKSLEENPHLKLAIPRNLKELKIVMGSGLEFRTITNKGITLETVNFQSEELADLKNELVRFNRDNEEVRVRFDKDDLRVIYIRDPFNETFIEAYPDEDILMDKKIRLDLPVPFYQIQLRSIEKSGELTKHIKYEDDHVGYAARAVDQIISQQKKDMLNGYSDTLEETKAQILQFTELGSAINDLGCPDEVYSINSIEEMDEQVKKPKSKKKGAKKSNSDSSSEESPEVDIKLDDGVEEELPTFKQTIRGVS
ncbi:Mu transposase C-terminal domain-containing protein [Paenibacillus sp. MAH-36]|uniref:Mu transposase C-terminal domain-containing protein n=1 Tax=Paenibacillus violae TaxID=3077234 RepID=A0ABU3RI95_9BACL|nr:Mu transposase C-terminal domain-containing protein [Paenibacillus sp. PFR10]MDU0203998.1 Mu transposase C-terminal domain-containing protein [Paenibacillus sp. PFR10]